MIRLDASIGDDGKRTQYGPDIAPPSVSKTLVPVDGEPQALVEARLLAPTQLLELGRVHGISVIVERPIMGVLDPLLELGLVAGVNTHNLEQLAAQVDVGDLVDGAHIVRLSNLALVKDCVKGVARITGKKIAAGRGTVSMEDNWHAVMQQRGKLGDNFYHVTLDCQ